jgi:integrase
MKNLNPRDLVFPTSNGGYQNPSNLHNRVWVPLQIALGLKEPVLTASGIQELDKSGKGKFKHRYRLYALRHVFASVKIKLGTSAKQLQMLMGHSSVQFHNGCLRSPVAR